MIKHASFIKQNTKLSIENKTTTLLEICRDISMYNTDHYIFDCFRIRYIFTTKKTLQLKQQLLKEKPLSKYI